jgi:hypothetical protein
MATKKQIAALQDIGFQNAAKNAAAATVNPSATPIPGQTPELTREEERLFGVYVDPAGTIIPGTRPPTKDQDEDEDPDKDKDPDAPPVTSSEQALFNAMLETMKVYNIQNFASTWARIRRDYPGIGSDEAMNLLRYDARYNSDYNQRFSGNAARIKNGFGALDEKTYLQMERGYSKIFKDYTLSTFDNTAQYAILIGNNVDVVETGKRVSLAYDRILNADDAILNAWRQFFPQLSTSDLTAMMLDPKNQLAIMERKVQSAEIGGAALAQGLNASLAAQTIKSNRYSNLTTGTIGAETVRGVNQTLAQTRADYEKIAGEVPEAEKLSSIYGGQLDQYGQIESEKANILGLASEKRKLDRLIAREKTNFQSRAGTSTASFKQPRGF